MWSDEKEAEAGDGGDVSVSPYITKYACPIWLSR